MSVNEIAEGEEEAASASGAVIIEPSVEPAAEPAIEPIATFTAEPRTKKRKRSTAEIMRDRRYLC